uniref:NADH-ubiquinone oxidoreductase chain 5 n=2 Tax=Haemaphysalis longicornis TaxID=44386 RepID=A0A481MV48_HAELO|nr:NADH dehydrogenase subunit 5 [Haemaphysalis longicornis]UKG19824.1 NADH dehydrogenase subunit 5 [Haemaphysalis longicornis]UKG20123.1 NADH dehydrogenase subunit 5 [Haemaphysalis longicornis]UKG20266.1 NADH dehydrogenase subunit 5 [Haemaphysalis longicornis]UKG20292.1 NADH dehydrogenase subunit 5 [Haemaphysalis longicornis]
MFVKWSMMLIFLSFTFFYFFFVNIFTKSFLVIEYLISWMSSIDMKFYFLFDWISNLFISIVLLISSMVILYSSSYMNSDKNKNCFCIIVLLFVLSMVLLILMPNMLMIILGWDGLGLVSYCLVIFYQSVNSYNSGMMTVISNRVGDVMIIMSLIFFFNYGTLDFLSLKEMEYLLGILIILAGMTKSAQIPFSAWLPAAMAAPTPVSSLVHSSTLVTAGVYLMIRFNFLFNVNSNSMFLLKMSLITMVMAGINAFFETDLKKIIAFSTLSQLSMMMIIVSLNMFELAFFHLVMHAIFKSMLFLCAGLIIHFMNGIQDIRMLGNFFKNSPVIMSCMLISILSLIGYPFIGGFYSKDLILEFFLFKVNNLILLFMFILGVIFTFLYCFRLLYFMMLKGILFVNFYKMEFDKKLIYPIYILTLFLLVSGNFLFWMMILNNKIMFISVLSKLFGYLSLLGVTYVLYFVLKSFQKTSFNLEFFYKMWFMSSLTSMIFMFNNKKMLKMTMMDWKWMEMMGPTGLKTEFHEFSLLSFWINLLTFNKILILVMLLMILII